MIKYLYYRNIYFIFLHAIVCGWIDNACLKEAQNYNYSDTSTIFNFLLAISFFYISKDLAFRIEACSIVRSDEGVVDSLESLRRIRLDATRWIELISDIQRMRIAMFYKASWRLLKTAERRTRIVDRISRSMGFEREIGDTWLHLSTSQKHMWPVRVLSIMHVPSFTMNKFISNSEVQVLFTTSFAVSRRER